MITPRSLAMRFRFALAVALVGSLAGCNSLLDETPVDAVPEDQAITNAEGARTALIGAYDALQLEAYYDRDLVLMGDLPTDNAEHTGTLTQFNQADANQVRADNTAVDDIWNAIYDGINRVNLILLRVPPLTDLDETEKNQILGEAHFLRALHYHNLVKLWGGVPLRLEPATSIDQSGEIARATVDETYTQILADLDLAEQLIPEDH